MKTQITEKMLEHIVYKSAIRLIQESLRGQMNFGTKGNIPLEPSSTLCDDASRSSCVANLQLYCSKYPIAFGFVQNIETFFFQSESVSNPFFKNK